MKTNKIKLILAAIFAFICVLSFAVGCKTAANYDYETFQKTYTCEFGSLFSLPARSYKGKSVVYEVKADGKTVEVFNNAFAVTVMADHDVTVKYKDGKTISRFTVIPKDAQAPEIFFDKTSFIAYVGESFKLPEITVTDNVDGKISNYTRKLYFNGKEIDFAKTVTPQAVGQYEYKVTAADDSGNKSEQSAYFPIKERKNVHDTVFALNSDYGMTEQIKPVFGANFSISEEIRYGDEPSLKIDFDESVDTLSFKFGNAYIKDISDYGYLFFSVYSDLSVSKTISVNWTSLYGASLKKGEWVDFIIPIDERLTGTSFNSLIAASDWTNPENIILFLQSGKTRIGGSLYLSNIYLIKTDKETFLSEGREYLGETTSNSFRNGYKKLTADFNSLADTDKDESVKQAMQQIKQTYFRLEVEASGGTYNPDTLLYGSRAFTKNMIRPAADNWSAVSYDTQKKRTPDSDGSVAITFVKEFNQPNACLKITDAPFDDSGSYTYARFYAYNGLTDYDANKSITLAFMGATAGAVMKSADAGWVEYFLPIPANKKISEMWLVCQCGEYNNYGYPSGSVYIDDITLIKDDEGEIGDDGTYCSYENSLELIQGVSKWDAGAYSMSEAVKHDGKNTLEIDIVPRGGRCGVVISYKKAQALFNKQGVKSVTFEFYYSVKDCEGVNYISLAYNGFQAAETDGAWHKYSVTLDADADYSAYFVLLLSYNGDGSFSNRPMSGKIYISPITYKCNY